MKHWRLPFLMPLLALLAIVAVTALIATQLIPTRGPFGWDESTHSLKGLVMAHDLRQGDWLSFAFNSYRQVLYPPLFSWLLALAYLGVGPSLATVAGVTLTLFALSAGLLYLAGMQLSPTRPNIAGAVAALLWLTAPPLIGYSIQGMLEVPGLFALNLAILVMLKLLADEEREGAPAPREYFLLGVAIAVCYFMRTPFGIILGLTVGLTLLIRADFRPQRLWRREIGWLLLPMVVIFAIWFAYTPKFGSTWQWLVNYPDGVDEPYSTEGWLFYPLALVRISGSPWLFGLYLVSLIYAIIRRKPRGLLFLALLVIIQVGIGEFHQNKQSRYLFPVLPAFFLLTGHLLATIWAWATANRQRVVQGAWAVGMALLLVQSGLLLRQALSVRGNARPDPISAYILETVDEAEATLIIGSMDMSYPYPPLLDWNLGTAGRLTMPQGGATAQVDEGRKLAGIAARLPAPLDAMLTRTFTSYDQPAPVRTLYVGLPLRASYSQGEQPYSNFVRELLAAQPADQVIVISHNNAQRYPRAWLVAPLEAAGLTLAETTPFDGPKMTVEVWRMP